MRMRMSQETVGRTKKQWKYPPYCRMDETGSNTSPLASLFFKKKSTRAKTEHELILILILFVCYKVSQLLFVTLGKFSRDR